MGFRSYIPLVGRFQELRQPFAPLPRELSELRKALDVSQGARAAEPSGLHHGAAGAESAAEEVQVREPAGGAHGGGDSGRVVVAEELS